MKKEIDNFLIIDALKNKYGLKITNLILLPFGADRAASVYKAETRGKDSYFVKLKHGHYSDISVKLLTFLAESGIQQVIPPIKTINDELAQQNSDLTIIVYPFVNGQNGFNCDLTQDQWVILGKALRHVHQLHIPPSIKDQIRKENYSHTWQETVRSLVDINEGDQRGDEISLKLKMFLMEHKLIIHRLVNRAETLSKVIQKQTSEFVLCHSDVHGGNILIDESGAIYIVDWDEPIMAPKEHDLMFIGGGVANVWNNSWEEEFFYKGYGETNINKTILSYYRHERIVKDIVEYGKALLLTSSGAKEDRLEMYKQFMAMFETNGVVDIAFKTDEDLL